MIKKAFLINTGLMASLLITASYASVHNACSISVAISTPPLTNNDLVAFNINNNAGLVKSTFLSHEHKYEEIKGLPCDSVHPYTISATAFANEFHMQHRTIGNCILKAGPLYLTAPESSAAVVFPQDFVCNSGNSVFNRR